MRYLPATLTARLISWYFGVSPLLGFNRASVGETDGVTSGHEKAVDPVPQRRFLLLDSDPLSVSGISEACYEVESRLCTVARLTIDDLDSLNITENM
jgi:hypothetical protein